LGVFTLSRCKTSASPWRWMRMAFMVGLLGMILTWFVVG
jgi:hypothetical protein